MEDDHDLFYENLRKACAIYAKEHYSALKAADGHVEFSRRFKVKMSKLINMLEKRQAKARREKQRAGFVVALSRAAMLLVLTIVFALTITISVEATRNNIIDFLAEFFDDHIRITAVNMDSDGVSPVSEESGAALAKYVDRLSEMGYEISEHRAVRKFNEIEYFTFESDNVQLFLSSRPYGSDTVTTIHYDNNVIAFSVNEVDIYEAENGETLYWYDDANIYLLITDLSRSENIKLIENLLK